MIIAATDGTAAGSSDPHGFYTGVRKRHSNTVAFEYHKLALDHEDGWE